MQGIDDRPPAQPEIRGMFGDKGDSADWLGTSIQLTNYKKIMLFLVFHLLFLYSCLITIHLLTDETSKFPNGVPRFNSREECLEFMENYNTYHGGSNPNNPNLMHIFTMLTSWSEIESILLPNITKARKEPSFIESVPRNYLSKESEQNKDDDERKGIDGKTSTKKNVYESKEAKDVVDAINFRLDLPIHKCTTIVSTLNTLKYLFFHMKCGIFVMIRNGKLRIFAPFVNSDYRNTWGDVITLEGDNTIGRCFDMVEISLYFHFFFHTFYMVLFLQINTTQ